MSQNIRATPLPSGRHGSTAKVLASGMAIMSDSSIALKPVIEEPSKPMPPSNASSSSSALMEKLLSWPRMSVNQKRMNLMSRSWTIALTSSAVCGCSWTAMRAPLPRSGAAYEAGKANELVQPGLRPGLQGAHGGLESAALVREGVLHPHGGLVDDAAFDDPLALELLEALGEQPVGQVRHQLADLGEAKRPVHQHAEDGAGPALAHQLDGAVVERA